MDGKFGSFSLSKMAMRPLAGLTHREKRHVDARVAVGQGCFGREGQGQVSFGGSSHGAFVRRGDSDTVGGRLFMKEVEGLIS